MSKLVEFSPGKKPIRTKLKGLRPENLMEIFAVDLATYIGDTMNNEQGHIFICTEMLSGFTWVELTTSKASAVPAACMQKAFSLLGKLRKC